MERFVPKQQYDLSDFISLISFLRSEAGCPWDKVQTHESIRRNLLEEAYELCETIDDGDIAHMKEELGDVLMQVLFHTDIEARAGHFTLDDVADAACKKLVYRHPNLFGGETGQDWEALKRAERGESTTADAMAGVAKALPALWRAEKIQKKAAKVGFDWPDVSGALDKVAEETAELKAAMAGSGDLGEEFGDLLFAAVNVGRFLKLDPEKSLTAATDKFAARFRKVEQAAEAQGKNLADMTLAEMDELWDQAKKQA